MNEIQCDFCGSQHVVWSFPARDFALDCAAKLLGIPIIGSRGPWAACPECAALVEGGERGPLCLRSLVHLCGPPPDAEVAMALVRIMAEIHEQFFAARTGPAVPVSGRPQ
jgi:hypothetical protein